MEKITDLRKLDKTKLNETLNKKTTELVEKKILYTMGKSSDASIFKKMRQDIARIKTVLKEKDVINASVIEDVTKEGETK